MKKVLIIYNPVSGNKKWGDLESAIKKQLNVHKFDYTWYETKPVKHQDFDQFKNKKFERIIGVGGDGTIAEIASFIIKNNIKIPLGIISTGSANLLARALKLPVFNIGHAIKSSLTEKFYSIDAMKINNNHYGLIATGCGYDTHIMHQTSRSSKRLLGLFAYICTIMKTFLFYKARPFKLTIDKNRYVVMAKTIMVFNIVPFGHLQISQDIIGRKINPADGILEVFAINSRSFWNLFSIKAKPHIQSFIGKKIAIKSKKERKFQIDGDLFKKGKSMEIEVVSKAINIIYKK